ncbi:hypothetical protein [Klebsiella pneumoniae]|uniref:hypothetical protein n=1 Tax=Klebsiella pneumoniae TaxID=573 RepID=UPI002433A034|nr:hypothetical protein [Klebsiella pneumoniae]MDG5862736.1 hypothetical protein [Klebsiella pneumoniae]
MTGRKNFWRIMKVMHCSVFFHFMALTALMIRILRFGREIDKFDFHNTMAATERLAYKLPALRYELLDTYLRYLQSVDFLPVPHAVNAA